MSSIVFWTICPLMPIALTFHFTLCLYWIFDKPINNELVRITIFCLMLSFLWMPILSSIGKFNFYHLMSFLMMEIIFTLPSLCLIGYIIEKNSEDK